MFTRLRLALTSLVLRVRGLTRPATTLKQPELPAAGATLSSLVSGREEALAAAVGRLEALLLEAKEAQAQLAEQAEDLKASSAFWKLQLRRAEAEVAARFGAAATPEATALIEKSNCWTVNT